MQDRQADPYGRGSYCIVVALHGDKSREAEVLRGFRDSFLERLPLGERIVDFYYAVSPTVSSKIERTSITRRLVSSTISLFAGAVSHLELHEL